MVRKKNNFIIHLFINFSGLSSRKELSEILNFHDFQSQQPDSDLINPWKQIEELKAKLQEKENELQKCKQSQSETIEDTIITSDSEEIYVSPTEFVQNMRSK